MAGFFVLDTFLVLSLNETHTLSIFHLSSMCNAPNSKCGSRECLRPDLAAMRERDGPVEYGICTGRCQSTAPHAGPGQTVHSLTTWPSVIPCAKLHLQLTGVTGQIQHTFISLLIKRTWPIMSNDPENCQFSPPDVLPNMYDFFSM